MRFPLTAEVFGGVVLKHFCRPTSGSFRKDSGASRNREHIPLHTHPPLLSKIPGAVTDTSPTYRLVAALLVVAFGMSWGAPLVQACCAPASPSTATHCGTSAPADDCDVMAGLTTSVCVAHHASQDLRNATPPSPDFGASSVGRSDSASLPGASIHGVIPPSPRPVHRTRRHARVGVWLE